DHRVLDGHRAAKFLKEFTEILEDENKLRAFLS
ncbi:2-oxo acid dehydrogenase subunit E2, partial [Saccharolobus sp.]